MKRLLLLTLALLFIGCASTSTLQKVQMTQTALATAQDLEAQICWGVSDVTRGPVDRTHCTTAKAAAIGLTDVRHQELNTHLRMAFNIHRAIAEQARNGAGTVDTTALKVLISSILAVLGQLAQTPDVVNLANTVKLGQPK